MKFEAVYTCTTSQAVARIVEAADRKTALAIADTDAALDEVHDGLVSVPGGWDVELDELKEVAS